MRDLAVVAPCQKKKRGSSWPQCVFFFLLSHPSPVPFVSCPWRSGFSGGGAWDWASSRPNLGASGPRFPCSVVQPLFFFRPHFVHTIVHTPAQPFQIEQAKVSVTSKTREKRKIALRHTWSWLLPTQLTPVRFMVVGVRLNTRTDLPVDRHDPSRSLASALKRFK